MPEYRTMKIEPETHRRLRMIAADTGEKLIDLVDRLAREEQQRKERNMQTGTQNYEREIRNIATGDHRYFDDTCVVVANSDGSYSVTDNGEEERVNTASEAASILAENLGDGSTMQSNDVELIVRIPTNEEHYTQQSEEEWLIPGLLDNQEQKIREWLHRNHPGMTYEIERVPEKLSLSNRDRAYSEEAESALERLNQYIEDNWVDWFPTTGTPPPHEWDA